MKSTEITNWLSERFFILDGASGTGLQQRGLPKGVCPEMWVLDNPEVIQSIHQDYFDAGSDAVYSCTFGASAPKLAEWGITNQDIGDINRRLVEITRKIVPEGKFLAGDIGPTGCLIDPAGPLLFEEAIEIYKEQIAGLIAGGVDFLVIETMLDIQETRAALIAAREISDLPVMACMTFETSGRTLSGTTPEAAAVTLRSLGACAVGCNCSTGPNEMKPVVTRMYESSGLPVLAKPNAGLPQVVAGDTVFPAGPDSFARDTAALADCGASLLGGCCGTTPAHIGALKKALGENKPKPPAVLPPGLLQLTSSRELVTVSVDQPVTIIGEKINPTGRKKLQTALREGRFGEVTRLAEEQAEAGAGLIDVNVGMSGVDEPKLMCEVVKNLSVSSPLPLCLDSASPEALARALRLYPGRALINSISAEKRKIEELMPIVASYGAGIIMLPVSDEGVAEVFEERVKLIKHIFNEAEFLGYTKSDVVVDGLTMTVSANKRAAKESLAVIDWAANSFGANSVLGLSNISFGLPQRRWINAAFLALATSRGLSMAIANPQEERLGAIALATDVLLGRDENCLNYISMFSGKTDTGSGTIAKRSPANGAAQAGGATDQTTGKIPEDHKTQISQAVLHGDRESITELIQNALAVDSSPFDLVNLCLIPALTEVGRKFGNGELWLPQLMMSAETMENAFTVLRPLLETESSSSIGTVIIATVKGDVHDIGKNIVALMLRNHGFNTIDLGRDVSAELIKAAALEHKADIVMLSALMTTTMTEMKTVIDLFATDNLPAKVLVGGAVVTDAYAREIGAAGYAADAVAAVNLARDILVSQK